MSAAVGAAAAAPLSGRSVVVTRAGSQSTGLAARLADLGAGAVLAPTVAVEDPADAGATLAAAVGRVEQYDWVVLTSPNGAERFVAALGTVSGQPPAGRLSAVRVAAVGPGTEACLRSVGVAVDLLPEHFVAESLLGCFPAPPPEGGRVLLARAAVARELLPEGLRSMGWTVDVVEAYRTVAVAYDAATRDLVRAADAVTFTSSSTVRSFVEAMGGPDAALEAAPPVVVCIGPITASTAQELGFASTFVAHPHSLDGLVDALVTAFAGGTA